ncbi:MAG TPA: type II CAAX endopeptidase family protein [Thermoanaerobaculia bacterium]|nr:type II CAAX endopeptidase family protein [Thermoanaerobaculia bacterium]
MEPSPALPSPAPGRLYRLAWGLYMALAVGGAVWIGLREGIIPLRLFIDIREWWLDLLLGISAGLLLLGLWKGSERVFPMAQELEDQLGTVLGRLGRTEVIALAVLSGFAEELFFRGAVQGTFGWVPATILFALLHTGRGRAFRLWTVFALIAGLLFGGLMEWRGNLLGPVVAHFLVNAVNLWRLASPEDSGRLPRGSAEGEKES